MSRRRQHRVDWRSGHAPHLVLPGYGERHVRMAWFGTGEARLASLVSKDRSYKPMVKTSGGKRESDGVVVPLIAVSNAAGGKGPDFGHVGRGGKREGMAGTAPPNYPEGRHLPPAKVRQLQNRLWAAAKQSSGRRFHALYDRIWSTSGVASRALTSSGAIFTLAFRARCGRSTARSATTCTAGRHSGR